MMLSLRSCISQMMIFKTINHNTTRRITAFNLLEQNNAEEHGSSVSCIGRRLLDVMDPRPY